MMRTGKCPAISFVFCLLGSLALVACDQPVANNAVPLNVDRIFHNAHILTMSFENEHDEMTIANAVAIKDGRIIAVTNDTYNYPDNWIGQNTQITNLDGRTLMPGFVQSHAHFNLIGLIYGIVLGQREGKTINISSRLLVVLL